MYRLSTVQPLPNWDYVYNAVASRSARSRSRLNGASKISRRPKAGLERVRAQGKNLGRPDGFVTHGPTLARMKAKGYSQGQTSRETGLAVNTVKGYLKLLEAPNSLRADSGSTPI